MARQSSLLEDLKLPDYQGRHLFTARLRIVIFILFWLLTLTYFQALWKSYPYIPAIISVSFVLTAICYYNIINMRWLLFSVITEMTIDVLCITIIVYMTGGASSDYFLVYIIYTLTAGNFYGLRIALYASIIIFIFYSFLLLAISYSWLKEFVYPAETAAWFFNDPRYEYFNYIQLIMFLPVILYAVKISHYFVAMKERALAEKNEQLLALHTMSTAIQKSMSLEEVIPNVLDGMIKGLGFETCLISIQNKKLERLEMHVPKNDKYIRGMERFLNINFKEVQVESLMSAKVVKTVMENRVIFKSKLTDFIKGIHPRIREDELNRLQEKFSFKKFVIAPIVVEKKVIGALIAFSCQEIFDQNKIEVLRSFIDQAALAIETAILVEELKEKNLQLIQANKVKTEFLAVMSHELRTPLAAVLGFSDLLIEGSMGKLNEEQSSALKEVQKNAEQLLQLINNLLDLAQMDNGKLKLKKDVFSLSDLVEDLIKLFRPLFNKKKLNLKLHYSHDLPCIYADPQKCRQIIINLLSNAIKFTPENGSVYLRSYLEGAFFIIEVIDSGIGIDEADFNKIFELFKQADSSLTRHYEGAGIGLALCKQLAELHGGKIEVKSEIGIGSSFKIKLPYIDSKQLEDWKP